MRYSKANICVFPLLSSKTSSIPRPKQTNSENVVHHTMAIFHILYPKKQVYFCRKYNTDLYSTSLSNRLSEYNFWGSLRASPRSRRQNSRNTWRPPSTRDGVFHGRIQYWNHPKENKLEFKGQFQFICWSFRFRRGGFCFRVYGFSWDLIVSRK